MVGGYFRHRVNHFFASIECDTLNDAEKSQFLRLMLVFVLKINRDKASAACQLRSTAIKHNCLEELMHFKTQYLEVSQYIHRTLWVRVLENLDGILIQNEDEKADAQFVVDNLTKTELNYFAKRWRVIPELFKDIDIKTWTTGASKQRNFKRYVYSKVCPLRFISNYDPGQEVEDFMQDIACEIIRVQNSYCRASADKLEEEIANGVDCDTRLKKYIEASLNNKIMAIKKSNSCSSKARIISTRNDLYEEREKLKKKISKNPNNKNLIEKMEAITSEIKSCQDDYILTVSSLTKFDSNKSEEDWVESTNFTEKPLVGDFELNQVIATQDEKTQAFIKIVLGQNDPEFEKWAEQRGYNLEKFDALVRGAKKFCKVDIKRLRSNEVLQKLKFNRL